MMMRRKLEELSERYAEVDEAYGNTLRQQLYEEIDVQKHEIALLQVQMGKVATIENALISHRGVISGLDSEDTENIIDPISGLDVNGFKLSNGRSKIASDSDYYNSVLQSQKVNNTLVHVHNKASTIGTTVYEPKTFQQETAISSDKGNLETSLEIVKKTTGPSVTTESSIPILLAESSLPTATADAVEVIHKLPSPKLSTKSVRQSSSMQKQRDEKSAAVQDGSESVLLKKDGISSSQVSDDFDRIPPSNKSHQDHSADVASGISNQFTQLLSPLYAAINGYASRQDIDMTRVAKMYDSLIILDKEHSALLTAHKELIAKHNKSEATIYGLINQLMNVIDKCQGNVEKHEQWSILQSRQLQHLADTLNIKLGSTDLQVFHYCI